MNSTIGVIFWVFLTAAGASGSCPKIVGRDQWKAKEPRKKVSMSTPVKYVVIHHTYRPGACNTSAECEVTMRGMQSYHRDELGWNDIGYNFCAGGDDKIYEGRGWSTMGAHAPVFNRNSIGVCIIGDYSRTLPSEKLLGQVRDLIGCGVEFKYIRSDYQLVGHRQVRQTECPGESLYREIQTWPRWTGDVSQVPGISDT